MDGGPIRTCVGCRRKAPQHELIRLVAREDGTVWVDARASDGRMRRRLGRSDGRGAYVCPDPRCAERALRSGALRRALRRPGPFQDGFEEELLNEVTARSAE